MITVKGLTVRFQTTTVLADCSLTVSQGSCVGLLGPSGSGKSTLIRVLTGQLLPDQGSVEVAGWRPTIKRKPPPGLMGLVQQDPVASLDPLWNISQCIRESLIVLPRARRPGRAEMRRLVQGALAEVRLAHLDPGKRATALSVGQAQRVALARALVARPPVICADEPTSALDPTSAATIVRLLRKAADRGAAVLVVSHNRSLLQSFCDTTLEMHAGRIESASIPSELLV